MIDATRRKEILKQGKPNPPWRGEPLLGSIYGEEEVEAAVSAIRIAMDVSVGFGFSAQHIVDFEKAFAQYVGTKHAVAINSAGPGLDMVMRYLKLQPDEEVIVPAINFMAAPLAVMGVGAKIVWGEINPRTFQLDPNDVEKKITPKTRAIFPVHMNGLSAPMDDFLELARRYPHEKHGPLMVVGDCARACGGGYRGTKIGKKGDVNIFSLHTMKNITTLGEGGMITTDNDDIERYCRSVRFYGTETEDWGTSNVITSVQAAVGSVQLKKLDGLIAARRRVAHRRHELLDGVPEITLPFEPDDCEHSFYLYTCLVCKEWAGEKRDMLIKMMNEEFGAGCVVANPPVYEIRKLVREYTAGQSLPLSESIGKRLFCVSLHPIMTEEDNEYIAASLIECVERLKKM
ncbi:MAG TPA: DegT/DnrJ/EryC1/StrS family aminotransferase [bacterium]|nr:DegT/DnrJ/EryC1/StrS family aminotransferase [bacterium]HQL62424.1 DegT/DnrJ/EryC1/StrS family aminotransferase [bacterium]